VFSGAVRSFAQINVGMGANEGTQGAVMTKTFIRCAAVASLAVTVLAAPTSAQARNDGAVAAGIIGGLAVGAMIGSAAANNGPVYRPAPVYYGPRCYWARQQVWDGFGWRWSRVRVCN
jgi:hypothetical protein